MSTGGEYRPLTSDEIADLERGGSRAADWTSVQVADGFTTTAVARCTFSGPVRLGAFSGAVSVAGAALPAGCYDSSLHAVSVAGAARVDRVALLSHYDVADGAAVLNCGTLAVAGETSFGNGVAVEVFNEGGGREIKIYDRLTAQVAYLAACYRHRANLAARLAQFVDDYAAEKTATRGSIGRGARVLNCPSIADVTIGDGAVVDGALRLVNGSICSTPAAPATVGAGVVAENFIIGTGSSFDSGAMLKNAFVGQGCRIGRQFSAESSVFCANCEGFHGEAVSVLAGPYTVSHHKSTLLIAGMFSFFNAGSGTNQSNHMYKIGPVHQGILGRGSKTGSFSYLLWPARVGAFTAVMGKHYDNFDTRNLPFSYITERGGRSVISPAVNLFTVGTRRDGEKWPTRDRRTGGETLDLINFDVLSPYTVGRIMKGLAEITEIYADASRDLEYVNYRGLSMKRLLCRTAKKHYEVALRVYFGDVLAGQLESAADPAGPLPEPRRSAGGDWVDVLGLLAPKADIESLCERVENAEIADIRSLEAALRDIFAGYQDAAWAWANEAYRARCGKTLCELSIAERAAAINEWRDARVKLNTMIRSDAEKEFDAGARIGFGVDGGDEDRDADFRAVRGCPEENAFIAGLQEDADETVARAEKLLAALDA